MYLVGIDIGGSNIKFVLLRSVLKKVQIKILEKKKVLTPKKKSEIIEVLKREIKNFISEMKNSKIEGIGIAIASPLNEKGDLILDPPNLPCLKNCRLAKILKKDFRDIPIISENDVNCFTLAEALIGAGRPTTKAAAIIFGITLGSGIGGGISKAHKFFLPDTKKEIKKRVISPLSKKNVKIRISKLKDFTGAVGAGLLVYNKL